MELRDLIVFLILNAVIVVGVMLARRISIDRLGGPEKVRTRLRRGVGNALLVGQEFIEPSAELIRTVQQDEVVDEDLSGDDDGEGTIEEQSAALTQLLAQRPLDGDRVRRLLTSARDAGEDWRRLLDDATRSVLAEHPHLAPSMPTAARVAPLES